MPKHSESVWFEQVDTAFVKFIQKRVFTEDAHGIKVPVPVIIRKPDEDFKIEVYPCISLYNLYSMRDNVRYCPETVIVSRDVESKTLEVEPSAIPYTLVYQLDFWSKSQTEMNSMTRQWLASLPDRNFNLPLVDMSGKARSSNVLLKDDLKKSDLLEKNARLFHSMLTYHVWVELDEIPSTTKPMVVEIITENSKQN